MAVSSHVATHSQFGKHHRTRIPHFGRAVAYCADTCELLLAGAGEEIFRLSLERGSFLSPMRAGCSGINVLGVDPTHGMVAAGTSDGDVQCWDPRQRERLGSCCPFDGLDADADGAREVTAVRFDKRGLRLAVGLSSGHVAIYDIRRSSPLRVKDHNFGLPIVDLKFHGNDHVVSADKKIIKARPVRWQMIWRVCVVICPMRALS